MSLLDQYVGMCVVHERALGPARGGSWTHIVITYENAVNPHVFREKRGSR
jgi:hypothetical protein